MSYSLIFWGGGQGVVSEKKLRLVRRPVAQERRTFDDYAENYIRCPARFSFLFVGKVL